MQQLTFIGTLHGMTPKEELEKILNKYKPDQLLVEITQEAINREALTSFPPEMIDAYNWAKAHNTSVLGFDSKIDVLAEGKAKEDVKRLSEEQDKIIKKYNWRDFNKERYNQLLNTKSWHLLINERKFSQRQNKMYENIATGALKMGEVLVITGSGHIPFFRKKFPQAKFPLS